MNFNKKHQKNNDLVAIDEEKYLPVEPRQMIQLLSNTADSLTNNPKAKEIYKTIGSVDYIINDITDGHNELLTNFSRNVFNIHKLESVFTEFVYNSLNFFFTCCNNYNILQCIDVNHFQDVYINNAPYSDLFNIDSYFSFKTGEYKDINNEDDFIISIVMPFCYRVYNLAMESYKYYCFSNATNYDTFSIVLNQIMAAFSNELMSMCKFLLDNIKL